jgi:hypothetical protein
VLDCSELLLGYSKLFPKWDFAFVSQLAHLPVVVGVYEKEHVLDILYDVMIVVENHRKFF